MSSTLKKRKTKIVCKLKNLKWIIVRKGLNKSFPSLKANLNTNTLILLDTLTSLPRNATIKLIRIAFMIGIIGIMVDSPHSICQRGWHQ